MTCSATTYVQHTFVQDADTVNRESKLFGLVGSRLERFVVRRHQKLFLPNISCRCYHRSLCFDEACVDQAELILVGVDRNHTGIVGLVGRQVGSREGQSTSVFLVGGCMLGGRKCKILAS